MLNAFMVYQILKSESVHAPALKIKQSLPVPPPPV